MSYWKKCSNCKKELKFEQIYQACSISSCNHSRSGLQFCTVSCWSAHVPIYRHKDAWAIEKKAPSEVEWSKIQSENSLSIASPQRKIVGSSVSEKSAQTNIEKEILVVVSKLKGYISSASEMNTSADVMEKLSDHLRELCDKAIKNAQSSGRKTVMGRDFPV
jgi:histone H3/H4